MHLFHKERGTLRAWPVGFGQVAAARRWALRAAALTTALAILDAFAGSGVILTRILVLGPLLAAARCGPRATAALSGYAVLLGLLGGLWNDIFFEGDHLARLPGVIGAAVAAWIANLRQRSERTREHMIAQNALAVTLVEARSVADGTPMALEVIGDRLNWQLGALWRSTGSGRSCASSTSGRRPASRPRASSGSAAERSSRGARASPAWRGEREQPAWIEDVTSDERYTRQEVARQAGLRAALAFPVFGEDKVVGVVEFYAREIRSPQRSCCACCAASAASSASTSS